LILRSLNLRGGYESLEEIGSREEEVDIFCLQEVGMGKGERFYGLEGYGTIGGVGGYIKTEEGLVVCMLIRDRWKGKYVVLGRYQGKIGVRVEVEGGKIVDVWNVYLRQGKHEKNLGKMESKGNVVRLGIWMHGVKDGEGKKVRGIGKEFCWKTGWMNGD